MIRYLQVMARMPDGSLVHIGGPDSFDEETEQDVRREIMRRIRQLSKQKPQYFIADLSAVGFAKKKPRKKRR